MVAQDVIVHDVWATNFDAEFSNMRKAARKAAYVIPFIEFPGVCMTPLGTFYSREHYAYQQLLINVNTVKPIQLGFTFIFESPHSEPSSLAVYQFNLHFDVSEDMFTADALQSFEKTGLKFSKHSTDGIKLLDFGELLTTSGLINSKLGWASFYSAFDFGYLTRSLCGGSLPPDIRLFYKLFRRYFSNAYDIRQMLQHPELQNRGLRSDMTLQEVADVLNIQRSGEKFVAASDSMLAANVFIQLKNDLQPTWSEPNPQFSWDHVCVSSQLYSFY